jgi:hypothetical protein
VIKRITKAEFSSPSSSAMTASRSKHTMSQTLGPCLLSIYMHSEWYRFLVLGMGDRWWSSQHKLVKILT